MPYLKAILTASAQYLHPSNLASLAVAGKLGFDKTGYLHIEDYCRNKEVKSSINNVDLHALTRNNLYKILINEKNQSIK